MTVRELLSHVLKNADLERHKGRPLYAYRSDPDLAKTLTLRVNECLQASQAFFSDGCVDKEP